MPGDGGKPYPGGPGYHLERRRGRPAGPGPGRGGAERKIPALYPPPGCPPAGERGHSSGGAGGPHAPLPPHYGREPGPGNGGGILAGAAPGPPGGTPGGGGRGPQRRLCPPPPGV